MVGSDQWSHCCLLVLVVCVQRCSYVLVDSMGVALFLINWEDFWGLLF